MLSILELRSSPRTTLLYQQKNIPSRFPNISCVLQVHVHQRSRPIQQDTFYRLVLSEHEEDEVFNPLLFIGGVRFKHFRERRAGLDSNVQRHRTASCLRGRMRLSVLGECPRCSVSLWRVEIKYPSAIPSNDRRVRVRRFVTRAGSKFWRR